MFLQNQVESGDFPSTNFNRADYSSHPLSAGNACVEKRPAASVSKCPFTRFMQSLGQIETFGASAVIMTVVSWIRNFIAKPNPLVGRQGAVCPFMARALNSGSIFFKSVDITSPDDISVDELIKEHAQIFFNTEPTQGKARLNKAIVLVFPHLQKSAAETVIEETQHRLKPFFVERGLMLGEFHQNHQGEGIHNKDFRPLQSPVPLLIIRHLIPSDLIFLNRKSDSAARRAHFIKTYLNLFPAGLPHHLYALALSSHKEALSQMEVADGDS